MSKALLRRINTKLEILFAERDWLLTRIANSSDSADAAKFNRKECEAKLTEVRKQIAEQRALFNSIRADR